MLPYRAHSIELGDDFGKIRDVLVALKRDRPHPCMGTDPFEERPNLGIDSMAVCVDGDFITPRVPSNVHFDHSLQWQCAQESIGVVTMVDGVDVEIVQVEKHPGVGRFQDTRDEARFVQLGSGRNKIVCDVFQKERAPKGQLDMPYVPTNHTGAVGAEWDRQEPAKLDVADTGQSNVITDPVRVKLLYHGSQGFHICGVGELIASDGKSQAVKEQAKLARQETRLLQAEIRKDAIGNQLEVVDFVSKPRNVVPHLGMVYEPHAAIRKTFDHQLM